MLAPTTGEQGGSAARQQRQDLPGVKADASDCAAQSAAAPQQQDPGVLPHIHSAAACKRPKPKCSAYCDT